MKQRFSSLDVKVIAAELNSALTSLRVSNIYDLSSRIFLFKCAKPGSKQQLLVDSGFRAHLTSFSRTAASSPSQFVTRLRKYLKSRRITGVAQIGTDRVIEIRFSDGQYRLFLEFFAAGNIILTDADLTVLALLRQVSENDPTVDVKLGSKYVLDAKQNFEGVPPITRGRIVNALQKEGEKFKLAQEAGGKKAKRNKGGNDLRKALSMGFPEFPPHLLDHVFTRANIDASLRLDDVVSNDALLEQIETALKDAGSIFGSFATDGQDTHKGYIIAKIKTRPEDQSQRPQEGSDAIRRGPDLLYEDYHPFLPAQVENKDGIKVLEIDTFNRAVDQFYSSLESQKLSSRLTEREEHARKKLESAKQEHEKRLEGLQHVQELHIRKAQAIEANTHRVEEACNAVNGLVAQGMDWVDIGKLIENEQKRGNVVAQVISLPLKLHENTVTLLLDEPGAVDDDSDEETYDTDMDSEESEDDDQKAAQAAKVVERRLTIDLNLALTPWANAREYYDQKRTAAEKESKTKAASEMALKSMEKKTQQDLKKSLKSETQTLRVTRKQLWFEKFLYFISSDGYLVLGGRDAAQNEFLYRRHLTQGDIFVHADLHGASCVVIKNHPQTPDAPIPPSTLSQAGALSVCSSQAWDSKAVMAAYWVHADQVSKTAPTGEYLVTGGFMIRGQKNFLPPSQLLLGFGVYWLVSEGSRSNHNKNRIMRTESMVPGEAEMLAADARGLSIDDHLAQNSDDGNPEKRANNASDHDNTEQLSDHSDGDSQADLGSEDGGSNAEKDDEQGQRRNPLQIDDSMVAGNNSEEEDDVEETADEEDSHTTRSGVDIEEKDAETTDQEHPSSTALDVESGPQVGQMKPLHSTSKPKTAPPAKKAPRTKAAKRKAAKYALQDEEDKALAMQLLGNTKAEQRKAAEVEAKAAKEAKNEADRVRRRAQHNKAAEAEKARQARLAKAQGEGGEAAIDEDETEVDADQAAQERLEHLNIDLLVPAPEPGDELIAAVPVVAPWTALSRNKYKVKLQPGSMKKGKALKEVVGIWGTLASKGPRIVDEQCQDKEKVWPREIDLIKAWKVEEIVGVLPVKGVRLVQGGGLGGQANNASSSGKGKPSGRGGRGSKKR